VILFIQPAESSRFRLADFRFGTRYGVSVRERGGERLDDDLASLKTRENLGVGAVI